MPGVNHLLVPAKTGEVSEYATLENKQVSPDGDRRASPPGSPARSARADPRPPADACSTCDDVRKAVGAAGKAVDAASKALGAVLDTRHKGIVPEMLNSAGSVSAEWYIETLWHYLHKRKLLQGVRSFDVEFKQPARLADKQLHFSLPHPDAGRPGDGLPRAARPRPPARRAARCRSRTSPSTADRTAAGTAWHPIRRRIPTASRSASGT